jgi:hypothetical protein
LPRWASRLTLEVTDVRVQQLQDISEQDAIAEGVDSRNHFMILWDEIHGMVGPKAWGANPWIYALTFTVHKQNIDAMEK